MLEYNMESNLEKNEDRNGKDKIYVSEELAMMLQNARLHKGFTQNSLADKVKDLAIARNEIENSTTNLDISRIETKKSRRVTLGKIRLIEQVLELEEGMLSSLSLGDYENKIRMMNESRRVGAEVVNERSNSCSTAQPTKINFCYNCGCKLSKPGMNFCPNCGEDLRG